MDGSRPIEDLAGQYPLSASLIDPTAVTDFDYFFSRPEDDELLAQWYEAGLPETYERRLSASATLKAWRDTMIAIIFYEDGRTEALDLGIGDYLRLYRGGWPESVDPSEPAEPPRSTPE